jgi:hypothetical protein
MFLSSFIVFAYLHAEIQVHHPVYPRVPCHPHNVETETWMFLWGQFFCTLNMCFGKQPKMTETYLNQ